MPTDERTLIVMFADVSGSAGLFERLGDTEAMYAVERCLKRMTRSIDGSRGRTIQIVGDELLAVFESAEDACQAAIDMQLRIADLPPVSGLKLTIRIGLHIGNVVEADGKLTGAAVDTAARITGIARRDQIVASTTLVSLMSHPGPVQFKPMTDGGGVLEAGRSIELYQIQWAGQQPPVSTPANAFHEATPSLERMCVRYRGKAFLLDDKTPVLTLGRDLGNKLVIEDRKASRQHARIEKRADGYYLVDTSTNGTFVTLEGRQEVLVRRHELHLEENGRVCFGSSLNDPSADSAEFEHLK